MSIIEKIFRRRRKLTDLSLEELRIEEKRLEIRENQHINQIDRLEKQREETFNQGAKTKSPPRRRIYARRFNELSQRLGMIERDLSRVVKELMTLNRVRVILERQRQIPGQRNVLENLSEKDLGRITTLLEDDRISEEVYLQKLDLMLGVVHEPAYETQEIGSEGMEVLKTWEAMDEGELDFDEGLKEASQAQEGGGRRERPEAERAEEREAEPN
ncbi:MAG: hypothetical protein HY716_04410 [Planctomycetes bacterium]|nr:hypothetical protein [Planctomycetota bacterium]